MKEVLQIAYLRHLQDFYLFESVKDGIITSYVLKRNRKQANPKESRALFWVWAGRAGWKMTFFFSMYL